jgi:3-oxoacyl-[acyl-carrier-protein] synthase II
VADVLPKVITRRLDRLSVWSLAAAALALRDAGLDPFASGGPRTAVVAATGFGCLDHTAAYLGSAHEYGWQQTDPIYFPETLGNVPAAHVARVFGCLGPNVTVGSRGPAAETALLVAISLLRTGQADRALVLAGDTLTRALFDWYEVAGRLSALPAGFVPSEGVAAVVLEAPGRHRPRAMVLDARWVHPDTAETAPARPAPPCAIADGLADTGGLFRILTALGSAPPGARLPFPGAARSGSCAAVLLEAPADD